MFYILNFATHQFTHRHSVAETVVAVSSILQTGVSKDDIEIVNCFSDDTRLAVDEFLTKYKEE